VCYVTGIEANTEKTITKNINNEIPITITLNIKLMSTSGMPIRSNK
jgi:hypothetical protein